MAHHFATDIETARGIAGDNLAVTEAFVQTHYASVARFMRHLTGHVQDAEDLTQQAFLKAKQHIASYRGTASLRTWLFRVAFHEYSHWKRRYRRTLSLDSVPAQVENAYENCIEAEALLEALGQLPEAMREAFLLHEVQELSVAETANVLGVPQGTVKSRLSHGRKRLMALLGDRHEDEIGARHVFES